MRLLLVLLAFSMSSAAFAQVGATGATGASGASGATGSSGATGASGASGASGSTGASGATGQSGASGSSGATGATGSTTYVPATPGNWPSPTPSDYAGALDYLAAGSVGIPKAASGSPPTCGATQAGRLYLTAGYTLCVCNGTDWVRRLANTTAICSF